MSLTLIRAALETALLAISPPIATAYENVAFKPVVGAPYQEIHLMLATPADSEIGGKMYTEQGYLQINLFYPLDNGPGDAQARAIAIRDALYRGRSLVSGSVSVTIERTAEIGPGRTEGDRYLLPVKARFFSHIQRS